MIVDDEGTVQATEKEPDKETIMIQEEQLDYADAILRQNGLLLEGNCPNGCGELHIGERSGMLECDDCGFINITSVITV